MYWYPKHEILTTSDQELLGLTSDLTPQDIISLTKTLFVVHQLSAQNLDTQPLATN